MSEKLIMIEYDHDGGPTEIMTDQGSYSVESSKNHGLLYQYTGGPSLEVVLRTDDPERIWILPGIPVRSTNGEEIDPTSLGDKLCEPPSDEDGFTVDTFDTLISLFDMTSVDDTVFCKYCDDWMPGDDECDHIFWHREWGGIWWLRCVRD